jgi:hypothetical protein
MSVEKAIEEKIREAIERGEFDNLPGHGKPLDLDAYFNTPEDLRMAFAMLRSNQFVPEEVEIMKEIEALRSKIANASEAEQDSLKKRLNERSLALSLLFDRRRAR